MITRDEAQTAATAADISQLVWRDEVESTQLLANELLNERSLKKLPALVIAQRQTAGRGRGGNRWWSRGGGLTFSLVVDATAIGVPPQRIAATSIATANGICTAASKLGFPDCQIKWPNDILARGRKLSGLLIDARQQTLVIGVGLNVHKRPTDAPADVTGRSISLAECCGCDIDATETLEVLLIEIIQSLRSLGDDSTDPQSQWNTRSVLNGRHVQINTAAGVVAGNVVGIDFGGELLVQNRAFVQRVASGTVELVSPSLSQHEM